LDDGASLVSVDKANLMATSRLWRSTVTEFCARQDIEVRHVLVDRFAFELAKGLVDSAVVVTEGLFGDILTDVAAAEAGSIALCSSASLTTGNAYGVAGLFEPAHGSAPSLVGRNRANPIGAYLAVGVLLASRPETAVLAAQLRGAVDSVLTTPGARSYDLALPGERVASSSEIADHINERFFARLSGARHPDPTRSYGEGAVGGEAHVVNELP
jgi:isocitrate/isopropylmalate dehydrogenase